MDKEELKKEAYLYAKNSKDVQNFESGFDIAFNSYIAGAEPREKRIEELEKQIDKMKCPWTCKQFGNCIYSICPCDKWEMKEWNLMRN